MAKHSVGRKIGNYSDFFNKSGDIARALLMSIFGEEILLGDKNITKEDQKKYVPGLKPRDDVDTIMIKTDKGHLVIDLSKFKAIKDPKLSGSIMGKATLAIDLTDLSVWNSQY